MQSESFGVCVRDASQVVGVDVLLSLFGDCGRAHDLEWFGRNSEIVAVAVVVVFVGFPSCVSTVEN